MGGHSYANSVLDFGKYHREEQYHDWQPLPFGETPKRYTTEGWGARLTIGALAYGWQVFDTLEDAQDWIKRKISEALTD